MKVTILLRMRGAFCTKLLPVYDKPGLVNEIRFASLCMYCIQACEWFLASLIMYSFNSMWGDCLRTQRPLLVRKVIYHTLSIISGRIRDQYGNPILLRVCRLRHAQMWHVFTIYTVSVRKRGTKLKLELALILLNRLAVLKTVKDSPYRLVHHRLNRTVACPVLSLFWSCAVCPCHIWASVTRHASKNV